MENTCIGREINIQCKAEWKSGIIIDEDGDYLTVMFDNGLEETFDKFERRFQFNKTKNTDESKIDMDAIEWRTKKDEEWAEDFYIGMSNEDTKYKFVDDKELSINPDTPGKKYSPSNEYEIPPKSSPQKKQGIIAKDLIASNSDDSPTRREKRNIAPSVGIGPGILSCEICKARELHNLITNIQNQCDIFVKSSFVEPGRSNIMLRCKTELYMTKSLPLTKSNTGEALTWSNASFKISLNPPSTSRITTNSGKKGNDGVGHKNDSGTMIIPKWNQLRGDILFGIYQQDNGSRNEILGQVIIPLQRLLKLDCMGDVRHGGKQISLSDWFNVETRDGRVTSSKIFIKIDLELPIGKEVITITTSSSATTQQEVSHPLFADNDSSHCSKTSCGNRGYHNGEIRAISNNPNNNKKKISKDFILRSKDTKKQNDSHFKAAATINRKEFHNRIEKENQKFEKRLDYQYNRPSRLHNIMYGNVASHSDSGGIPSKSLHHSSASINRKKFEARVTEENKRISKKLQKIKSNIAGDAFSGGTAKEISENLELLREIKRKNAESKLAKEELKMELDVHAERKRIYSEQADLWDEIIDLKESKSVLLDEITQLKTRYRRNMKEVRSSKLKLSKLRYSDTTTTSISRSGTSASSSSTRSLGDGWKSDISKAGFLDFNDSSSSKGHGNSDNTTNNDYLQNLNQDVVKKQEYYDKLQLKRNKFKELMHLHKKSIRDATIEFDDLNMKLQIAHTGFTSDSSKSREFQQLVQDEIELKSLIISNKNDIATKEVQHQNELKREKEFVTISQKNEIEQKKLELNEITSSCDETKRICLGASMKDTITRLKMNIDQLNRAIHSVTVESRENEMTNASIQSDILAARKRFAERLQDIELLS